VTPGPEPTRRGSSLPIVGLVCSGLGLMFPPLLIVGLTLGIISVVQKKGSPMQSALAVAIPVVAMLIFGVLLATRLERRQGPDVASKSVDGGVAP
jgi:hypothetical protein